MIIIKDRELHIPNNERFVGTSYDNSVEKRYFKADRYTSNGVDLASLNFNIDIKQSGTRTVYSTTKTDTTVTSTLNQTTFIEKVGGVADTYLFEGTNGVWTLDDNTVTLSEYGITVTGTDGSIQVVLSSADIDYDVDTLTKTSDTSYVYLTWNIAHSSLAVPGNIAVQIRGYDGSSLKWSSYVGAFYVEDYDNINNSAEIDFVLAELEKFEQRISEKIDDAEEYATLSKSWAVGNTGERTGEDTNNSMYFSQQSALSATSASQSATTATTKATEASQSATSASTSATNAATSETNAATSETNASNSATSASNSATSASTSATNAATSETNASNSATSASNSAATATSKATEASNSATSASNSATSASNSATSASTSATNAQAYAEAIEDLTVSSESKAYSESASVTKTTVEGVYNLHFGIPRGTPTTVSSIQYATSISGTTPPTTWYNTPQAVGFNEYQWTKLTYSEGTVSYQVAKSGIGGIRKLVIGGA